MSQRWIKLGLLYEPHANNRHEKLLSHATNPLPVLMHEDVYRVFFSSRDAQNRSSVGAVDIDIVERKVVRKHHDPFLTHGAPESYYANGISIGNCYTVGEQRYMLFMGWQTPPHQHWRGDIGRLRVHPNLTLSVDSEAPLMASDPSDPISLSYPWVLRDQDHLFRMWYGSTHTWDAGNGEMIHVINHASSPDGHQWQRHGLAIPFALGQAQAFSRPTVVENADGTYEMWFSYRSGTGQTYRIGYAHSPDGKTWTLDLDNSGIDVSPNGWDSEMIEYPFVFDHKGLRYMIYNGNGYGKTGFGLAVLDQA